jgi:hypothetical protein
MGPILSTRDLDLKQNLRLPGGFRHVLTSSGRSLQHTRTNSALTATTGAGLPDRDRSMLAVAHPVILERAHEPPNQPQDLSAEAACRAAG